MRPHSFSKTFAEQHGVTEAIVLKHLAHKTRRSANIRDDKQWYYDSLDELMVKMPYLGRSTIDDAVNSLAGKGMLEIGNYNGRAYDRTRWFHVPEEHWDAVEERNIYFHATDAEAHGVTAAVLMFNLEYWLKRRLRAGKETHSMDLKKLADKLPFKVSTTKAALSRLVAAGPIVKVPGKRSEYAFPPDRMRTLREKARLR